MPCDSHILGLIPIVRIKMKFINSLFSIIYVKDLLIQNAYVCLRNFDLDETLLISELLYLTFQRNSTSASRWRKMCEKLPKNVLGRLKLLSFCSTNSQFFVCLRLFSVAETRSSVRMWVLPISRSHSLLRGVVCSTVNRCVRCTAFKLFLYSVPESDLLQTSQAQLRTDRMKPKNEMSIQRNENNFVWMQSE